MLILRLESGVNAWGVWINVKQNVTSLFLPSFHFLNYLRGLISCLSCQSWICCLLTEGNTEGDVSWLTGKTTNQQSQEDSFLFIKIKLKLHFVYYINPHFLHIQSKFKPSYIFAYTGLKEGVPTVVLKEGGNRKQGQQRQKRTIQLSKKYVAIIIIIWKSDLKRYVEKNKSEWDEKHFQNKQ